MLSVDQHVKPVTMSGFKKIEFFDHTGSLQVANLSTKIHRAVGAKKPPNDERLLVWCEDALDLEKCVSQLGKSRRAAGVKLRRSLANRFTPAA